MTVEPRAYLPPDWEHGKRWWGYGLHLYGLRSAHNWGMGDFTDLREFARLAARQGANLVGVNPLHALHWSDPTAASPYAPTSRHFLNPLYVDVEAIPEFATDKRTRALVASADFQTSLTLARSAQHVDYRAVALCKRRALHSLYNSFRRNASRARRHAFEAFVAGGGSRLENFARYEALTERFARDGGRIRGWLTWPEGYRDPRSMRVQLFARFSRDRVDFFKYLQFIAHEQLAAADSEGARMFIDLAVGVDPNGADVWSEREAYALDRSIGAPPDPLGPLGQNWGLAPLAPHALAGAGIARYASVLHAAMKGAGALRIDHVMSLLRLFLVPRGSEPQDGSYVDYPFDALLECVAGESNAAHCVVVGEDLGTVPDGFRDRMERAAILSSRVMLFERENDGAFRRPESYPRLALATATTHDLPTLRGWILARDIDQRTTLGQYDGAIAADARAVRRVDATRLLEALRGAGELDDETVERLHHAIDARATERSAYAPLISAAYRFLSRTSSAIVLVQLDDALAELDQVNLPGTFDEYPNWRRKTALGLEELESDEGFAGVAEGMRARIQGGAIA